MWFFIFLALFNGINISLSRVINARLGQHVGALRSSLINHIVGFLASIPIVLYYGGFSYFKTLDDVPFYAYIGGTLGVLFVWITSWLIPKMGVTRSTLLIIGGQMTFALMLDIWIGKISSPSFAGIGMLLILIGAAIGKRP